ncbi:hypothetical protein BGZ65_004314 [Modicella reniformis]|uniref:DNA endonuclease activator Ctp1 C-terminal domain-containing protein n=1 Tax=Modicella reniformis TaxID=1440133 RepID=A0A9P6INF8_9FUNG|nr:hypothetical protein BGZ65_004314 [Modicella reniformis]
MGSAEEPHVIFDDKDGNSSPHEGDSESRRNRSGPPIVDSEENDTSIVYGTQSLSLTFPSDLALRHRHYYPGIEAEDDDEEDDSDGNNHQPFGSIRGGVRNKCNTFKSVSPTTRTSETRNQRRALAGSGHRSTHHQHPRRSLRMDAMDSDPVQADRSSPLMFDSADFLRPYSRPSEPNEAPDPIQEAQTTEDPPRTPSRDNNGFESDTFAEAGAQHTNINGHSPEVHQVLLHTPRAASTARGDRSGDHGSIDVPETPLELQGIIPMKDDQLWPSLGSPTDVNQKQGVPEHENQPQPRRIESIAVDDDVEAARSETLPDKQSGRNNSNKENVAPFGILTQETRSHTNEDVVGTETTDHPDLQQQQQQQRSRDPAVNAPEQRIYNFTERRKDKRRQMHGHDCACCRRFYELTGPLPLPDGYNAFFTPAPRPGEKEIWEKTAEERLQERIQQISRHRVHHETPLTPPGFWDTDFPPTPDRVEWDRIAVERRDRKKQKTEYELDQAQRKT